MTPAIFNRRTNPKWLIDGSGCNSTNSLSTPRRFPGQPTPGATPFSLPAYELLTRPSSSVTPISLTRQSTPKCPSWGEEPQTVQHWLEWFPNAVALRQQLFGEPSLPLSVLTTNPGSVPALARKPISKGPTRYFSTTALPSLRFPLQKILYWNFCYFFTKFWIFWRGLWTWPPWVICAPAFNHKFKKFCIYREFT